MNESTTWLQRHPVLVVFLCTLVYVVVSLNFFQKHMPRPKAHVARPIVTGATVPGTAMAAKTPTRVQPDKASGADNVIFTAPVRSRDFINLSAVPVTLAAKASSTACAVQVLATCDHHYSYSHTYPNCEISRDGTTLTIPLRGDPAYWQADGHDGQWSEWETVSLRSLKVKVFAPNLRASNITASFGEIPLDRGKAQPTLSWLQPAADPLKLGERYELMFDIAGCAGNPFIPSELEVSLEITDPRGNAYAVPAFLHAEYKTYLTPRGEEIVPRGAKHWRARFRPFVEGSHTYRLKCLMNRGLPVVLREGAFKVEPGKPVNYSCIQPSSPRWFRNTDGTFYYPVGWNIVTPVDQIAKEAPYVTYLPEKETLTLHRKMIEDLADHGGNFYGLWMTLEWCGLEGPPNNGDYSGYGRYNLKNAWIADQIVKTSERRGLRILFDTINAGQIEGYWQLNPYSYQGGGFLDHTSGFWTDDRAIALQLARLRYIVGRYADSPAIHAWGYMSEPDRCTSAGCSSEMVTGGIARYLRYMKSIDVYKHIGTSHANNPASHPDFCNFPEVEFPHFNNYTYPDCSRGYSPEQLQAIRDSSVDFERLRRPMIVKEFGGNYKPDSYAKVTRDILGGLWAGACSRMAGTPMAWWSNFMYGDDLGGWYGAIASFMKGEDLASGDSEQAGGWNNIDVKCLSPNNDARALMSGNNTRRFLFVYSFSALCREALITKPCSNVDVQFSGMIPGSYDAEYWNIRTGKPEFTRPLAVTRGRNTIRVPDFTEGWAIKIKAASGGATAAVAGPVVHTPPPADSAASPCKWAWRITPLLKIVYEKAAERCAVDFTIALPAGYSGWAPVVRDSAGKDIPYAWHHVADGCAVNIRVSPAQKGPFAVSLAPTPVIPASEFQDSGLGADVESFYADIETIHDVGAFKSIFDSQRKTARARVARIEHFNNPVGESYSQFLARYRAPLFVPKTGKYMFAINSDDGGVLAVDGKVAVSWLGAHDAASYGSVNAWHNGEPVQLDEGVHWLAVYHQQLRGRTFIQANWMIPRLDEGSWQRSHFFSPFGAFRPDVEVIDAHHLNGLIPCSVEVLLEDKSICRLTPARGMELRKPNTRVFTLGVEEDGGKIQVVCLASGGRQTIKVQGRDVPVWADTPGWRKFSIECYQGNDRDDSRFMMARTFDIDIKLDVGLPSLGKTTWLFTPRRWQTWKLGPDDMNKQFTVSLAGIELLRENVKPWPYVEKAQPPPGRLPQCVRLLQPATVLTPCRIPEAALKMKGNGTTSIIPECVRFDLWTQDEQPLEAVLPPIGEPTGVVLLLDNTPLRSGLSSREFLARMDTHIRSIIAAKCFPVLAIDDGIAMESSLNQEFALTLVHLQKKYGCPLVDLRTYKEPAR